ncbi:MAG: ABC transporter permease [Bacteroidia bacterium]
MFDLDKWHEIYLTLSRNKLRTFLTALGVSWGIFMLIIMLGAGKGLENGVMQGFGDFATNSTYIWSEQTSKPYKGLPSGRGFNLNNGDIELIKRNVPEIAVLAPRNQLNGYNSDNNVTYKNKAGTFEVYGDYPEFMKIQPKKLLEGRFLNQKDLDDGRKVAVIGKRVQEVLFGNDQSPIEKYIQINGVYFKIVGLFTTAGTSGMSARETEAVFIPFSTFQNAFHYGNVVGWFAIMAKPDASVSVVEEKVLEVLKKSHQVAPDDERAFGSWNAEKEFGQMTGVFSGIRWLTVFVGGATLLAGVIGISNIMLIIIKERTKEIGIKRAIGATPANIMIQVMFESVILTFVAGYFGLVAGVGLLELVAWGLIEFKVDAEMFANPNVDLQVALKALAALVVAGIFAGLIPAYRTTKIKPVEALRAE